MPKQAQLTNFIADYLAKKLENIYYEKKANKIQKKDWPVFPTKESLVKYVFLDHRFINTEDFSEDKIIDAGITNRFKNDVFEDCLDKIRNHIRQFQQLRQNLFI